VHGLLTGMEDFSDRVKYQWRYKLCKSSVLIVVVYQKNVNLAYLLVDVLIAVVNRKKKDVVAGD